MAKSRPVKRNVPPKSKDGNSSTSSSSCCRSLCRILTVVPLAVIAYMLWREHNFNIIALESPFSSESETATSSAATLSAAATSAATAAGTGTGAVAGKSTSDVTKPTISASTTVPGKSSPAVQAKAEAGAATITKTTTNDACASQWLPDRLVGRCWGLDTSTESKFELAKKRGVIKNADDCQKLCCDLGDGCITWQYWDASTICKIGGLVRLGSEGGGVAQWCEPLPPTPWNGRKRSQRKRNDSLRGHGNNRTFVCEWGAEVLTGQCFGLGSERKSAYKKSPLSAEECAAGCCAQPHCKAWQHQPGRGCFYNEDKLGPDEPFCDGYKGTYVGKRKKKP